MNNAIHIALNDLALLRRDWFALFWILAFPLVFAIFFGAIFGGSGGGSGGMNVIVVDLDNSEDSSAFIDSLDESDAITVVRDRRADDETAIPFTRDTARGAVRLGNVTAYVVIPEGYGGSPMAMFSPDTPELEVGIDPSRKAEAGYLQGLIAEASFKRMGDMFTDPSVMVPDLDGIIGDIEAESGLPDDQKGLLLDMMGSLRNFADGVDTETLEANDAPSFEPVKIKVEEVAPDGATPPNNFSTSFPQAMAWGIIGCTAGFAITLVQEKTRGTELRLRVAPTTLAQILAGKGLACFLMCCFALVLLTVFGLFFGVRIGSITNYALAIVCTSFCFTGLMMLISTFGKTEQSVAGAGWAAMMPFAMLGGGMVPLMFMPGWMRTASNISPVKWAITSLEGAIWRDFTLVQMLTPCAILVAVGTVTYAIGVLILRKRFA